jgi:hypothetical protein
MKKAAVFILLGQSNAAGHGTPMKKNDIIDKPLKNVYGLSRTKNQTYENSELFWDNYTSFGMNLAEEMDNTYSLANQLARRWQENADNGAHMKYDDLYIVQIAIGSQGVTEKYMWYPERPKKLVGGKLGIADISLYSFTGHIISMIDDSFKKMGKAYEIIGVHWRGGEEDAQANRSMLEKELSSIYKRMISECNRILNNPPIFLHKLYCKDWMAETDTSGTRYKNMLYINSVFKNMAEIFDNVSVFDVKNCPKYCDNVRGNGIFVDDVVHYTADVNLWVADCIIKGI